MISVNYAYQNLNIELDYTGNKSKCDNSIQKILTLFECKEDLPVQVEERQED